MISFELGEFMAALILIFLFLYPFVYNPWRLNVSYDKFYVLIFFVLALWILTILKLIKKEIVFKPQLRRFTLYLVLSFLFITLSTVFSNLSFFALFGMNGRFEGYLSLTSYLSLGFFA